MNSTERKVVLGRVLGAFGVAGWVKVESYTDPPRNILNYRVWQVGSAGEWRPMRHIDARSAQTLQAQLEGVTTREQAAALRNAEIAVARSELPRLKPGEYYWEDLLELDAITPDGESLGAIAEIRSMPAHPVMRIVEQAHGKRVERLVPLVRERILKVDLPARRVTLDWQRDW